MFLITKDYLDETVDEGYPQLYSMKSIPKDKIEIAKSKLTLKFRLLDGDNEVYYDGMMDPDGDEFEPLDYLGKSMGCTGIEVFENGKWCPV